MSMIYRKLATRTVPPVALLRHPSLGHPIKRRYTTEHGLKGITDELTVAQRMTMLEKNVETGFSEMRDSFMWGGLLAGGLICAMFFLGTAREDRFEKKIHDQEARLMDSTKSQLSLLRSQVRTDHLQDLLTYRYKYK